MKKIVNVVGLILLLFITLGADVRTSDSTKATHRQKKKCVGYTIIEFGKGVDCNGDTLKLVRVNGAQVLAAAQPN